MSVSDVGHFYLHVGVIMQVEQISFHRNVIEAIKDENGGLWVSVRSICDGVGIEWARQCQKLSEDPKFICIHMYTVAGDGRQREMVCLPLNQLNGWLFSINPNKVREDIRPKLLQYQQECMDVLYKHFMPQGEVDMSIFISRFDMIDKKIEQRMDLMGKKLDHMACVAETVFGDDQEEIQELVRNVAKVYNVDGRTVWGWVQTECDVSSYKRQNLKVKNFLKNKLGLGIKIVKDDGGKE